MNEKTYFTPDEDFEPIIKTTLKDKSISNIKPVTTGWTNIVFEVTTPDGNFFFRFPRDDFWSRTIVKDYEFCDWLNGKLDVDTVHLHLKHDSGRPFSVHKKIEGVPLYDESKNMSPIEIETAAHDVANFMYQLHHLDFDKDKIFKNINITSSLPEFLDGLMRFHNLPEEIEFWNLERFAANHPDECLVHGDLNAKNVLLDKNGRVSAVIDFGFAGFGNEYTDVGRIIGSCPATFKAPIIFAYESLGHTTLDPARLADNINTMVSIDGAYITYMKRIGMI